MIRVIGNTGTLHELKSKLGINNLDSFKDFDKIIAKNKEILIEQGKEKCNDTLDNAKLSLFDYGEELADVILDRKKHDITFFVMIKSSLTEYLIKRKIRKTHKKIVNIKNNFERYSLANVQGEINNLNYKKYLKESLTETYYGAIGEEKVVDKFKRLFGYGVLINDFQKSFNEPIFTKGGKDIIMSMQIDHIFINEKGIFLIETKNRGNSSINNIDFSPVKQAQLHGHAFYIYLKDLCYYYGTNTPKIYNIILSTGSGKVKSYDKFIHSLTLNDLGWFINSRKGYIDNLSLDKILNRLVGDNEAY